MTLRNAKVGDRVIIEGIFEGNTGDKRYPAGVRLFGGSVVILTRDGRYSNDDTAPCARLVKKAPTGFVKRKGYLPMCNGRVCGAMAPTIKLALNCPVANGYSPVTWYERVPTVDEHSGAEIGGRG